MERAYTLYKTIGQSLTYFQVEVAQKGQLHLDMCTINTPFQADPH